MKNTLMVMAILFTGIAFGQQALGEVQGEVVEAGTVIPVYGATVYIDDSGKSYRGKTDEDGRFRISAIPAGTYMVNIQYFEDTMKNIEIQVPMDGIARMGIIDFTTKVLLLDGGVVTAKGGVKLIDGNLPVATLTAEEIDKSPVKFDVKGMVASMTSNVQQTADGSLVFRGARKGDMIYMIDGVKMSDAGSLPGVSIGYMMVYTGGLPAKYGDTLGGVVVIESKSYFDLYRSWEADQIKKGLR